MAGSVYSAALTSNGYYNFATGGKSVPFVTTGLGFARDAMDDRTRINPNSDRTTRRFEGTVKTGLVWSIGVGAAVEIGPELGSAPARLNLAWRYFDLGSVSGGYVQLLASGAGEEPVTPPYFDAIN